MMMSFNDEPSRRKDTTFLTEPLSEVIFVDKLPVAIQNGKFEQKYLQI
jgi:hypothetical protein